MISNCVTKYGHLIVEFILSVIVSCYVVVIDDMAQWWNILRSVIYWWQIRLDQPIGFFCLTWLAHLGFRVLWCRHRHPVLFWMVEAAWSIQFVILISFICFIHLYSWYCTDGFPICSDVSSLVTMYTTSQECLSANASANSFTNIGGILANRFK